MWRILSAPYRQLYYLQLEQYEIARYLRLIFKSFEIDELRQMLHVTGKLITVTAVALGIITLSTYGAFYALGAYGTALILVTAYLFFCVPLSIAVLILSPADSIAKRVIVRRASRALKAHPNVSVVAIAGSYGKTTMKSVLASVLKRKLRVVVTPDSFNTPLGIARTILKELTNETDVVILEFGEHYTGDLAFLAHNFPPDITIVTGINEAHLERFKTLDRLIDGIFEAVRGTKQDGLVVLNADSPLVMEHFKEHIGSRETAMYSAENAHRAMHRVVSRTLIEDGSGQRFTLEKAGDGTVDVEMKLLGGYVPGVASATLIVGDRFKLSETESVLGLTNALPVPHRLEPIRTNPDVLVIDDSYNGNPEGVRYAIELLQEFTSRRKVYVTPGLVEGGVKIVGMHQNIGMQLAGVADVVILVKNSVTPYIEGGLLAKSFKKDAIFWFNSAREAHSKLKEIVKKGDVVLFQNDWPDNYL